VEIWGEVHKFCGNREEKFINFVEKRGNMQYASLA